jgi:toluene monooxygenase system ferredoxin subunit
LFGSPPELDIRPPIGPRYPAAVGFTKVCAESDVPVGAMTAFFVDDVEVLVLRGKDGVLRAMDGICPHEDFPLVEGNFDGTIVTCAGHKWMFDSKTGNGVNPPGCRIAHYGVKVEDGEVFVDPEGTPEPDPA